ncbi:MAG TPA: heavy metal translocating P-type ATPase [Candidatus Mcinerneyibacterium sp.]|nr:heavy metal translocating P-type ATPase [Candidatus Mcinerneyibacterium sp.]
MNSKKIKFVIDGLHCANCAQKIENELKKEDYTEEVILNFSLKQLIVSLKESEKSEENIKKEIIDIVKKNEPDLEIYLKNEESKISTSRKNKKLIKKVLRLGAGIVPPLAAIFFQISFIPEILLYLIGYFIIGYDILYYAFKDTLQGDLFDEYFLMTLATLGAFAIGEYPEAIAVLLFYQVGEIFEARAVDSSRKSIKKLMDIKPDIAHLKRNNKIIDLKPEEIDIDNILVVKPGEKIPIDGVITKGSTVLDQAALTGENKPVSKDVGDEVLSGSINKNAVIEIKTTKRFEESTVSKILELVEEASNKKSKTEKFITKFSKYYTPSVIAVAFMIVFLPMLLSTNYVFSKWLYRGLIFLVISCPCALVLSVPLAFFAGLGKASNNGILIKGSNYLDKLSNIKNIVFDKTGTLTEGNFKVRKIVPENKVDKNKLLEYAAYSEYYSNHPIANAIKEKYSKNIDESKIKKHEVYPGKGVSITMNKKKILAGNIKLMKDFNIYVKEKENIYETIVYIALNNKYKGYITVSDKIKENSKETISELINLGIENISMLTGDENNSAEKTAEELNISEFYSELLPDEKVRIIEKLKSSFENIVFVGDGINDAPVIKLSDIGISMGNLGSDAAIEASDIVLMDDDPLKLVKGIKISKYTKKIAVQNIILALGIKLGVLVLGSLGLANLWMAIIADTGVALLAVLNSLRILRK